jgi:hypothetical protein
MSKLEVKTDYVADSIPIALLCNETVRFLRVGETLAVPFS